MNFKLILTIFLCFCCVASDAFAMDGGAESQKEKKRAGVFVYMTLGGLGFLKEWSEANFDPAFSQAISGLDIFQREVAPFKVGKVHTMFERSNVLVECGETLRLNVLKAGRIFNAFAVMVHLEFDKNEVTKGLWMNFLEVMSSVSLMLSSSDKGENVPDFMKIVAGGKDVSWDRVAKSWKHILDVKWVQFLRHALAMYKPVENLTDALAQSFVCVKALDFKIMMVQFFHSLVFDGVEMVDGGSPVFVDGQKAFAWYEVFVPKLLHGLGTWADTGVESEYIDINKTEFFELLKKYALCPEGVKKEESLRVLKKLLPLCCMPLAEKRDLRKIISDFSEKSLFQVRVELLRLMFSNYAVKCGGAYSFSKKKGLETLLKSIIVQKSLVTKDHLLAPFSEVNYTTGVNVLQLLASPLEQWVLCGPDSTDFRDVNLMNRGCGLGLGVHGSGASWGYLSGSDQLSTEGDFMTTGVLVSEMEPEKRKELESYISQKKYFYLKADLCIMELIENLPSELESEKYPFLWQVLRTPQETEVWERALNRGVFEAMSQPKLTILKCALQNFWCSTPLPVEPPCVYEQTDLYSNKYALNQSRLREFLLKHVWGYSGYPPLSDAIFSLVNKEETEYISLWAGEHLSECGIFEPILQRFSYFLSI